MRWSGHAAAILITAAIVLVALPASADDAKHGYFTAGIGMGELLHVEAGAFVGPRTTVDLSAGWLIFNVMTGVGVTRYFGRGPGTPRHALLASGRVRFNPLLDPVRFHGGGETIATTAEGYVGYGFTGRHGFAARFMLGALVLPMGDHLEGGPNFLMSLGVAF
jgi:hypothetical protein